ncbi:Uncharacterized protein TCM_005245 [Theobroma cacao]|uniref:Uncharacterized protein n=1 Tax=Theobroma cacao TaxID=3641 RepID=A0A061E0P9_THECC|nr:Uncharacterized protein TCM_005245 [Theobroma cacao]
MTSLQDESLVFWFVFTEHAFLPAFRFIPLLSVSVYLLANNVFNFSGRRNEGPMDGVRKQCTLIQVCLRKSILELDHPNQPPFFGSVYHSGSDFRTFFFTRQKWEYF